MNSRIKRTLAVLLSFIITAGLFTAGSIPVYADSDNQGMTEESQSVVIAEDVVTPPDGEESVSEPVVKTPSENSPSQNAPSYRVDFYVNGKLIASNYTVSDGSVSSPSVDNIQTETYLYEFLFWVLDPNDTTGYSQADLTNIQSDTTVYAFFKATPVGEEIDKPPVRKPTKPTVSGQNPGDEEDDEEDDDNSSGGTTIITSQTPAAAPAPVVAVLPLALAPVQTAVNTPAKSSTPAGETEDPNEEDKLEDGESSPETEPESPEVKEPEDKDETTISEDEVPLANPETTKTTFPWYLLLVAFVLVAGITVFAVVNRNKDKEETK